MYIAINSGLFDGKNTILYYAKAIPDRIMNNPFPFRGENGNRMFYVPFIIEGKLSKGEPEDIGTLAYTGEPDENTLAILRENNISDFSGAGASLLRKLALRGYPSQDISLLSFAGRSSINMRSVESAQLEEIARQLKSLHVHATLFQ